MRISKMNRTAPSNFCRRSEQGKSLQDYNQHRHFSHIVDEYDFRINNKLLVQKIINPRRDKVIMESLTHVSPKYMLRKKKIVPPNEKQSNDGRNALQKKIFKKSLEANLRELHTQSAMRQNNFSNFGQFNTVTSALESNMEQNGFEQAKEVVQFKHQQKRGSSLRNNFVGRIVKNSQRSAESEENEAMAESFAVNELGQRVEGIILGQSWHRNNSGRIKKEQLKSNFRSSNTRFYLKQNTSSQIRENRDSKTNISIGQNLKAMQ